jgi:hypothetical protein
LIAGAAGVVSSNDKIESAGLKQCVPEHTGVRQGFFQALEGHARQSVIRANSG